MPPNGPIDPNQAAIFAQSLNSAFPMGSNATGSPTPDPLSLNGLSDEEKQKRLQELAAQKAALQQLSNQGALGTLPGL